MVSNQLKERYSLTWKFLRKKTRIKSSSSSRGQEEIQDEHQEGTQEGTIITKDSENKIPKLTCDSLGLICY